MAKDDDPNKLDLSALSTKQMLNILLRAGSKRATQESIERDLENGAPLNSDGTMHMIRYAAWLAEQVE